jgi:hypothetical protein
VSNDPILCKKDRSDSHPDILAAVQTENTWQPPANVPGRKDEVLG